GPAGPRRPASRAGRRLRALLRRPVSFAIAWCRLLWLRRRVGRCRVRLYPEGEPTASRGQPAVGETGTGRRSLGAARERWRPPMPVAAALTGALSGTEP